MNNCYLCNADDKELRPYKLARKVRRCQKRIMNLTIAIRQVYTGSALAKSSVRIRTLKLQGATKALIVGVFLCLSFMVGCSEASTDAPLPCGGSSNSVQPAALRLEPLSGSYQTSHKVNTMSNLTILSNNIRELNNLFSLNDLHKASGYGQNKRPKYFLSNQQTKDLIDEISIGGISPIYAQQGLGTFGCKEIVIAYGAWISPKVNLAVIRAFLTQQERITSQGLTPAQQRHIQNRVKELASKPFTSYAVVYSSIKDKFKVGTYKDIPNEQYGELCRFLECTPLEGELINSTRIYKPESDRDLIIDFYLDRMKSNAQVYMNKDPYRGLVVHDMNRVFKDFCSFCNTGVVEQFAGAVDLANGFRKQSGKQLIPKSVQV